MLNDFQVEALATDILTRVITELTTWSDGDRKPFYAVSSTDAGDPLLTYAGTSTEGYGSFVSEYASLDAVQKRIRECERVFDAFRVEVTDKQTGEVKSVKLAELPVENQAGLIGPIESCHPEGEGCETHPTSHSTKTSNSSS